jgi:UDPglucose 6-dehydrogenase
MGSKVAVIGTGYVGLTTGTCFAHLGHDVICADVVPEKVESLSRGEVPILEKGLDELVHEGLKSGRLRFVLGAAAAVRDCEFAYLCVPTPQGADGSADMSYIEAAAREIAPHLPPGSIVVNKSTVPVGSTRLVEQALGRSDVAVVSNPEFLREGSAVADFLNPDRVVIGADDQAAAIRVASLYIDVHAPYMVTDPASAETIKYASNAFLATKLSFVNAVAAVCEAVGADVKDVVLGMGYDKRIGQEFLKPGPGWGGSCFPKDVQALVRIAEDAGYDFGLLKGVVSVNEEQFDRVADKVVDAAGGSVDGKVIAAWGLTFKANTDDLRMSPSIQILRRLIERGAIVKGFDPAVSETLHELPAVEIVGDAYAACEGASVLVLLTEWDEFKWLDLDKMTALMINRSVVDTRNLLDGAALRRRGFSYQGIGRS